MFLLDGFVGLLERICLEVEFPLSQQELLFLLEGKNPGRVEFRCNRRIFWSPREKISKQSIDH